MPRRKRIDPSRLCTHTKDDGKKCMLFLAKNSKEFCHIHRPFEPYECNICYNRVECKEEECIIPECGHKFCAKCIVAWFVQEKTTCPYCRGEIPSEFIEKYDSTCRLHPIHIPWSYIPSGTALYQLRYLTRLSNYITNEMEHIRGYL